MSAQSKSFCVFLVFAALALAALAYFHSWFSFILISLMGMIASGRIFTQTATLEEKRTDLAERNRHLP